MTVSRRSFLAGTGLGVLLGAIGGPAVLSSAVAASEDTPTPALALGEAATPFSDETVVTLARTLAQSPFSPPPRIPDAWLDLSYDQYRDIRFNTDAALWRNEPRPFEMQVFPPGLYFQNAVEISIVENGLSRPLLFDQGVLTKGTLVPELPDAPSLGYSGFRLHGHVNRDDYKDEFVVFQGASYFRGVAKGQNYGLSARGLALRTADPAGEEFPVFRAFWVEAPEAGQDEEHVRVHALLDSESTTGAFVFDIRPGKDTTMEVSATLFPRVELTKVGIAPLTSMFLFDATSGHRFDDFRPAVHDSDGLFIHNGAGEWLWRALANPKRLQISAFLDHGPRGFGLLQRARALEDFHDLEAHYHTRPGLWIEPRGDWGAGAVVLVEIPADKEIYDNIVAFWQPAAPLPAGEPYRLDYRMLWTDEPPVNTGLAPVIDSRSGAREAGGRIFSIEFAPTGALGHLIAEAEAAGESPYDLITADATASQGTILNAIIQRRPDTGAMRMNIGFDPEDETTSELRCVLRHKGRPLSEIWLYRWTA